MLCNQERSTGHGMLTRPHVPYRNSMLTAMLKDSLGGNCTTAMLATISSETSQLEESVATCRFAQRVAMITNKVSRGQGLGAGLFTITLKGDLMQRQEPSNDVRGHSALGVPAFLKIHQAVALNAGCLAIRTLGVCACLDCMLCR
jgi:Kinesin motor domain